MLGLGAGVDRRRPGHWCCDTVDTGVERLRHAKEIESPGARLPTCLGEARTPSAVGLRGARGVHSSGGDKRPVNSWQQSENLGLTRREGSERGWSQEPKEIWDRRIHKAAAQSFGGSEACKFVSPQARKKPVKGIHTGNKIK